MVLEVFMSVVILSSILGAKTLLVDIKLIHRGDLLFHVKVNFFFFGKPREDEVIKQWKSK